MSDFTPKDGPGRVGELLSDRAFSSSCAARGIRDRDRPVPARDGVGSGRSLFPEVDGETSGENGGDEGPAGDESWSGDMGRLRAYGGGLVVDKQGEDWLEGAGERDGEDGPEVA